MPKFLSAEELYRVLQRELPVDVYVDSGSPSAFFSTSDNFAAAQTIETLYSNLQRVYDNFFPGLADERLSDWEFTVFGEYLDASLSLNDRHSRILAKIRSRQGITIADMIAVVQSVIGLDKNVQIVEWGCDEGAWTLNVSALNISTVLVAFSGSHVGLNGPFVCEMTAAQMGLTQQQLLDYRRQAYTYEVRIIGYMPTPVELAKIDSDLDRYEPARSDHVIYPNYMPPVIYTNPPMETEDGDILTDEDGDVITLEG